MFVKFMQLALVLYVLKLSQCSKGLVNFKFVLQKKTTKFGVVSPIVYCLFWTGRLCSNWLCQTEELDEAQTNCGLFI